MNYTSVEVVVPLLDDAVVGYKAFDEAFEASSVAAWFGNENAFSDTSWCICSYSESLMNSGVGVECGWREGPKIVCGRGTVDGPGEDGYNGGVYVQAQTDSELHGDWFVCLF